MDIDNKDWRQLEKLAYYYIKNKYRGEKIQDEKLTDSSHDSGYDGTWVLIPSSESMLPQLILMEAKLRNKQASLSLNDCAKSIIIAFNMAAKKLFIVTNIGFAPQTKSNVSNFKKRSNLLIDCIDGNELKDYINNNWNYLTNEGGLNSAFLNSILNFAQKLPAYFFDETAITDTSDFVYMMDYTREEALSQIIQNFCLQKGICLLTGNAGVGKSILKQIVHNELSENNFDIYEIDLQLCISARVLYINILESIWGINLSVILEDNTLKDYINVLMKTAKGSISSDIINAVTHILLADYSKYEEHKDVYLYLLLKYIDAILEDKREELRLIISFDNLNMASEEIINFLLEAVNILKKNNIRIILETRTPFSLKNMEFSASSNKLFRLLKQCADFEVEVKTFFREDSIKLIQKKLESLNSSVSNSLADILSDNPLEIMSAIKLLPTLPSFNSDLLNKSSPKALEAYWEKVGISRNTVIVCLIRKLRFYLNFSELFELCIIFRSHIPLFILERVFENKYEELISSAIDSTIFTQQKHELVCTHLRYMDAMRQTSNQSLCFNLAHKLLELIRIGEINSNRHTLLELELLYITEDFRHIPSKTLDVMTLLVQSLQFKDSLSVALRYITSDITPFTCEEQGRHLEILLFTLTCILELHEENNRNFDEVFDETEVAIITYYGDNKDYFELRYQLALWEKFFNNGEFEKAYNISRKLYDKWIESKAIIPDDNDYPGQIYRVYGLSLKMSEGGEKAEQIFLEGTQLYKNSFYAKASLLSQQGNALLKTNPLEAAITYQELLNIVAGEKFLYQEELHTRIDIAMSYFLAEEYGIGKRLSEEAIRIASSIGVFMQKGRALNILGCCLAAQGKLNESFTFFQDAITCLKESNATIFLWRAELNLASILLLDKETIVEAREILSNVTQVLLNTFKTKIVVDEESVPFNSMLLIMMYLQELDDTFALNNLLDAFRETPLSNRYYSMKDIPEWRNLFHNKVKFSETVILVTG